MNNMKKSSVFTIGFLLLIVIGTAFIAYKLTTTDDQESVISSATEDLTGTTSYTDLNGNPFDFSVHEGKVRVVNSWASWCPFCVAELHDFSSVASEYSSDEVVIIAINRAESIRRIQAFIKTLSDVSNVIFVQDATDYFYQSIGGFAMPETIFYDKDGNIAVHKRGFMTESEIKIHIDTALSASD